ncbi:MAG: glycosyltransferase [Gallionella sp.]|nr:glycosyltransferase [Gallionella sp.]MDD4946747.1 glycosyltransferase [Gallionella sp.]
MLITLSSVLVSFFVCYFLVRYQGFHARFSHDHTEAGPQKFHAQPTPRIGGVGIFLGVIAAYAYVWLSFPNAEWVAEFGFLVLASLPAFAGGLVEDLTKRVSVLKRLILSMVSACVGVWLLDAVVTHLGFFLLDWMFQWSFFAIVFTVFAVGGVVNAVNIIDGFNGIVSGFAGFMLLAIAIVSLQLDDIFLLKASLAMLGAMLGFLYWNYPYGKIFLGDGGSYLVGFWLAEMAVLIVARHPTVSPWFAALLLIHPVCETLFSVYRRKLLYGKSPWHPDGLHLHTLIFRRLNHIQWASSDARHKVHCNSMTAPYFWVLKAATALLAVLFWNNSFALILSTMMFVMLYVWLYWRIVKFRTPRWLVRRDRRGSRVREPGATRDRRAPYRFGFIQFRLPRWVRRNRRRLSEGEMVVYDRRMTDKRRNTNE